MLRNIMNEKDYGLAGAYPGVLATFGPGVRALYVPEKPGVGALCTPGVGADS